MGAYPVTTAARLAGLTPDLLRAWERRYQAVVPVRGPRGARLYSARDVEHLRLLARLVRDGRRIGDVVHLDAPALRALAADSVVAPAVPARDGGHLAPILAALAVFDGIALGERLGEALVAHGGAGFAEHVVAPLLVQIGERWRAGQTSIAEEHLLSATLRGMLGALVQNHRRASRVVVVLATPPGERHEFGLLLVAFAVVQAGLGLCYLGPDLPAAEIATAARAAKATVVGLGCVHGGNAARAAAEVRALERRLPPATELWLGGRATAELAHRRGRALVIRDLPALRTELARVRDAHAPRGREEES